MMLGIFKVSYEGDGGLTNGKAVSTKEYEK